MAATKITIGNAKIQGFVNQVVDGKRLLIGTGSYKNGNNETVFKESISVFIDPAFNGTLPEVKQYVEISGDLNVQPRKDNAEQLNGTMNVRFANQITVLPTPQKRDAKQPETAGADSDSDI